MESSPPKNRRRFRKQVPTLETFTHYNTSSPLQNQKHFPQKFKSAKSLPARAVPNRHCRHCHRLRKPLWVFLSCSEWDLNPSLSDSTRGPGVMTCKVAYIFHHPRHRNPLTVLSFGNGTYFDLVRRGNLLLYVLLTSPFFHFPPFIF